jgi:hypothetical protein
MGKFMPWRFQVVYLMSLFLTEPNPKQHCIHTTNVLIIMSHTHVGIAYHGSCSHSCPLALLLDLARRERLDRSGLTAGRETLGHTSSWSA